MTGPLNVWLKTAAAYSSYPASNGIIVNADGLTINGLTITGFGQGIVLGNGTDGTTLSGVVLQSNFAGIHKPGSAAVTNFTMLNGQIIDGHLGMDIVRDAVGGGGFDIVLIDGTSFADLNRKGIYAEAMSHADLLNLIMSNVGEFGGITTTGSLGAGGNGINLNLKYGIYDDILIEGFTLTNVGSSDRDGLDADGHQNGGAIVIAARDDPSSYNTNPAALTNVIIRDGSIDGTSTGIEIGEPTKANATPNVLIENVDIDNAQHSARHGEIGNQSAATTTVEGTSDADSYIASGNSDGAFVIDGNGGADTLTTGSANDTLTGGADNDALDGKGGIDTAVVTGAPVFTENGTIWTLVSGDGTDTLANIEKVSNGTTTYLLVGAGGYATIQAAVNAAGDGDVIVVAAGTYVEQVVINGKDDLTIEAASGATVILQAPDTLVVTGAHAAGHNGGANVYGILTAIDSLNLSINGITIDGAGNGDSVPTTGENFAGIFFRNSSGALVDVDITGVRSPYQSGTTADGYPNLQPLQAGTGVLVDNDTLLGFTMTGGSIDDYQKNAGRFWGGDLDISGVTVTGGGAQTTGRARTASSSTAAPAPSPATR